MGATIYISAEATELLEDYINARDRLQEVNDQIETLDNLIDTFYETHEFDDIFNDDFMNYIDDTDDTEYVDDGGCNDGGCNDGGCNDGAYS